MKCADCMFWNPYSLTPSGRPYMPGYGRCHRYPPTDNARGTNGEDWCGEFKDNKYLHIETGK